jgi:magnesium transporter
VIIDSAVYQDGKRLHHVEGLQQAADMVRDSEGCFAWVGLHNPTADELAEVAKAFTFHPLALEDASSPGERPKVELIGDSISVVLNSAHYIDDTEQVEFGQVSVLLSDKFVVVTRVGTPIPLVTVRTRLEQDPEFLKLGTGAVLYAVVDRVVSEYGPVLAGVENDILEVESVVFGRPNSQVTSRIYFLLREVLSLQRSIAPLAANLDRALDLGGSQASRPLRPYFVDVQDSIQDAFDRVLTARQLLDSALQANLTQVSIQQNEDMRKMSAWAALLAIPTMIAGIYGMNFQYMPELGWTFGYPLVLLVMGLICFVIFRAFKRSGWL